MRPTLLVGVLIFLASWYAVSYLGLVNPVLCPPPHVVASRLWEMIVTAEVVPDVLSTLYRMAIGFGMAATIGVPLGLLIGYVRVVYEALEFMVEFFRSVPATALFPLFMLFLGIGDTAKISVVVFSAGLINIVNAAYGVKNARHSHIAAAKSMRATNGQIFLKVILPGAMPHIFAGLRTTLSLSLILVVVTEMFIGTGTGLGERIYNAHLMFRIPEMYAAIVLTGIMGYALNKVFVHFERRLVHWYGK